MGCIINTSFVIQKPDVGHKRYVALVGEKHCACTHLVCGLTSDVLFFHNPRQIAATIEKACVIICHFGDKPGYIRDFNQILDLKKTYPSIPIITTANYEDRSHYIWALRSRIWDHVILPQEYDHLKKTVSFFLHLDPEKRKSKREIYFPDDYREICTENESAEVSSRIWPAIAFISRNYFKKLSLSHLAALCNMSASTFALHFKKETGTNLRRYLINLRINEAKQLLKSDKYSIKEIALTVGFEDVSHFNRRFKAVEKLTPGQYRNRSLNHS